MIKYMVKIATEIIMLSTKKNPFKTDTAQGRGEGGGGGVGEALAPSHL